MIIKLFVKEHAAFLKKFMEGDDRRRPFMNYVRIEREDPDNESSTFKLITSNGRCLAMIKTGLFNKEKVEEGSYEMLKKKSDTVLCREDDKIAGQFPSWKKVMPEKNRGFIKIEMFHKSKKDLYAGFANHIADIMHRNDIPYLGIDENFFHGLPAGEYTLEIHNKSDSYYYHFYNNTFELLVVSLARNTLNNKGHEKIYVDKAAFNN